MSSMLDRFSKLEAMYFLFIVGLFNIPQIYQQTDQLLSGFVKVLDSNGNPTLVGVGLHALVALVVLDLLGVRIKIPTSS